MTFRLTPMPEHALAQDELADLPVQLKVRGRYLTPVDGIEEAEIEVRFDSSELADLLAQGRAAQLTLAQRARRDAEAVWDATQLVTEGGTTALTDTGTLQRLAGALYELPDTAPAQDSPERGGPRPGENASWEPVGGTDRDDGWSPEPQPSKEPLPRRQRGEGD